VGLAFSDPEVVDPVVCSEACPDAVDGAVVGACFHVARDCCHAETCQWRWRWIVEESWAFWPLAETPVPLCALIHFLVLGSVAAVAVAVAVGKLVLIPP